MTPASSAILNSALAYVVGYAWGGITSIKVRVKSTGLPPANALVSCQMIFQNGNEGAPLQIISNGNGITITDAANWEMTVPRQNLALPVGKWDWLFSATDSMGISLPYGRGTIEVQPPF